MGQMLMLTTDTMDMGMDWVTTDWATELMDMDTLMLITMATTTARGPLMLMLMLSMDIMAMVTTVTTDWATELMDTLTTAGTTTARDPLMLSPRSLATPVSLAVSTVDSPLPMLLLLLRPLLLPSLLPMPPPSMLSLLSMLPQPLSTLPPPLSTLSTPPPWSSTSATRSTTRSTTCPRSLSRSTPPSTSPSTSSPTPPWSEPTLDFLWLVFPWLPPLPLLRMPSKFHFRKENLIKMSLHHQ